MMILGLGAGGCGLASLAHLLAAQEGSIVTKEAGIRYTGWQGALFFELAHAQSWRKKLDAGECLLAGDVGYYHLPYAYEIAKRHADCRVVWLGREPERMAERLLKGAAKSHPWIEHLGDEWQWAPHNATFPATGVPDPREAARIYVEFYHQCAARVKDHLGKKMRYFATRYLDSERGQREILEFCGVENPVTFRGGVNVNP